MTTTGESSSSGDEDEGPGLDPEDLSSGTSSDDDSTSFVSWCRGIFTINPDVNASDENSQEEDSSASFEASISSESEADPDSPELNIED